jgi:hypothetical protein
MKDVYFKSSSLLLRGLYNCHLLWARIETIPYQFLFLLKIIYHDNNIVSRQELNHK